MDKNRKTAEEILKFVGGKDNVKNLFHCMTRLRFNLTNDELADVTALRNTPGVMGAQDTSGEFQVIIGPAVEVIYNELIKLTGLAGTEAIPENLDAGREEIKKKLTFKGVVNNIFNIMSGSLAPLVPLFVVVGVFNTVAVLIGPQFLALVTEDADIYKNFYYVGQAILYFLPILVAFAASKRLGSNTLITMTLACVMLYPDFVAIATGEAAFTVLGIPMTLIAYNTSVIPIILIAWVQSYVEKLLNKITPDAVKVIVVPSLTVLVMLPVGLCALGPLGNFIGFGLGQLIVRLYDVAGPVATTIAGATIIISGVSEPSLFGIFLQHRRLLIATAIGGGLAGFYLGIMRVGYYVFGPSNFLNIMGFIGGETANLINGSIAAGIGLVSTLIATLLLEKGAKKKN